MKRILISEDAFRDLNEGFLFYEAQEFGLGDYFTACLRADIEGLKITAGIHREFEGFYRLLSRVFPHGIFYTVQKEVTVLAIIDLRRNPDWISDRLLAAPATGPVSITHEDGLPVIRADPPLEPGAIVKAIKEERDCRDGRQGGGTTAS